jgi:hypothetical protein
MGCSSFTFLGMEDEWYSSASQQTKDILRLLKLFRLADNK